MKGLTNLFAVDAGYQNVKNKLENNLPNTGATGFSGMDIINYLLYAGGIVAVVMIIIAGVQMTTSAGDAAAVAKAKTTMTWAIVGLVVMILAYAIINFVIGKAFPTE